MMPSPSNPFDDSRPEAEIAPARPAAERWRHALTLFTGYWRSSDWRFAWSVLIALVAAQFAGVYMFVLMNRWQQRFFDSVQARDIAGFGALVAAFVGILTLQMVFVVLEPYIRRLLCLRWRVHTTDRYIDRWMARNRYAEIERLRIIDNPDQRIADDLRFIADPEVGALSIVLQLVSSAASVWAMVAILLETSDTIRVTLAGWQVAIPGGTVVYAILYVIVSSVVMVLFGKPYIRAMMRWQYREADFRSSLVHVRRNAPQIGLADAVGQERRSLHGGLQAIHAAMRTQIRTLLGINAASGLYDRLGSIIPLFILVPRYFAGAITFGQVMGGRDAFRQLVPQLGFFIQLYPRVATQLSYINRIKGLDEAIDTVRPAGIAVTTGTPAGVAIATRDLSIRRPRGQALVTVGDWQVRAGERWVIRGASGAGKSTLVRAIAGLWPDGGGTIALAAQTIAMIVPQRLYLPLGTLKTAICFPDAAAAHDDAAIAALLDTVHLPHLADALHAQRLWCEELSPGEQQQLALARILLHMPSLLILDEATSALDPATTRHFHAMLDRHLPRVTLVGVVHDERLHRHYDHALDIVDGRASAGPIEGAA